jgi:hypothetical protein
MHTETALDDFKKDVAFHAFGSVINKCLGDAKLGFDGQLRSYRADTVLMRRLFNFGSKAGAYAQLKP